MKISVINWRQANTATLIAMGLYYAFPEPASAQPPQVQNYLNMSAGDIRMFVGGTGTKTGEPVFGTTWGNSTTLSPPLPIIDAISQSPLHKKILLLQRYDPSGGYPAVAGATPITRTGSTQGSFKILALQRTPTGAPRPAGKTKLLINLNASASGYAKTAGGTTYYPPNIPVGMTYNHTLKAWLGTDSSTSTSSSVSKNQLATIDWDTATLVSGESDIYEAEVSTGAVGAEASAQFSNCYGYPLVSAWATPSVDTRSVVITRGVGSKEKTVYEGGIPVTYGDSTYSY